MGGSSGNEKLYCTSAQDLLPIDADTCGSVACPAFQLVFGENGGAGYSLSKDLSETDLKGGNNYKLKFKKEKAEDVVLMFKAEIVETKDEDATHKGCGEANSCDVTIKCPAKPEDA